MWALGYYHCQLLYNDRCVFAELLLGKSHALFPGINKTKPTEFLAQKTPDQFQLICEKCGTPSESEWPGHKNLPYFPTMMPKKKFPKQLFQHMKKQKPQ